MDELGATLLDTSKPLWDRYSAMFKLRNINTDRAIKALAQGNVSFAICWDDFIYLFSDAGCLFQAFTAKIALSFVMKSPMY